MAKKESLDLQLPTEQIEYIRSVAKLAGVSTNSAASVLLAVQVMRWNATNPQEPKDGDD